MSLPILFDLKGKRVWVAGHRGMVGSAIARRLVHEGCELLTTSSSEVDLTDQSATRGWMEKQRPDAIFLAAARVGGIFANSSIPADFISDNLAIALNVIRTAHHVRVG